MEQVLAAESGDLGSYHLTLGNLFGLHFLQLWNGANKLQSLICESNKVIHLKKSNTAWHIVGGN